jgi:hypothetical protein
MLRLISVVIAGGCALQPAAAFACGCFTPPDPTVPVVQAGEKILFAVKEGQVTAHVQVQYSGNAAEFGWLLPLPAVPTLELGVDELFTQLTVATQPKYRMQTTFENDCYVGYGGTGGGSSGTGGGTETGVNGDAGTGPVVVVQDSIGPYDYAVLKADSKDEMLSWLAANHYFVPAGTDDSVAPYIHSGAFFLALKLKSGRSAGDLQPVVLHYASDVGMIPITLTSTGAKDNMGVQVWMLGEGRAIPRNYHHTVLNDAAIDWPSAGSNYQQVIIRAAGEAPGKHTFVTEYAGSSTVMRDQLAPQSRFGAQEELAAQPTLTAFQQYLFTHGFTLTSTLQAILTRDPTYQPAAMAQEIWDRIVKPTRAAQALLDSAPTLTRLYTTISPADMNKDPAFSFNPSLPDVSNVHEGEMHVFCNTDTRSESFAVLRTEQGWSIGYPNGRFGAPAVDLNSLYASLRIEILSEEGPAQVVVDHSAVAVPETPRSCSATGGAAMVLIGAMVVIRRMNRRPSPQR